MRKDKTIVEKMINMVDKYYKQVEKTMDESDSLNHDLETINAVFTILDPDDFSFLKKIDHESLSNLLKLVLKDDEKELDNAIRAAHFLAQNDIDLVGEQTDKLRDLISRSDVKKRSLQRLIDHRAKTIETLEDCSNLEDELKSLIDVGVFEDKIIQQFFDLFHIKEAEKSKYLDEILKLNTTRILTSIKEMSKDNEKSVEILDVPLEVVDMENKKITEEQLKLVFEKNGFDFSVLKPKTLNTLLENGDLSKIDEILSSLKDNKLDFVRKDGKILAKFLLESSKELIEEGCKVFEDAHISKDYLRSYKSIFFLSEEEAKGIKKETIERYDKRVIDAPLNNDGDVKKDEPLDIISGKHRDFFQNLNLLESLGYDRKFLLERHVNLLIGSNHLLLRRLEELKLYEFPMDNTNFPLSTLSSAKIMDLTDEFIEVGERDYILNNSSRLVAYVDGVLDRLYALKKEKMEYCNSRGYRKTLKSFVTDLKQPCGLSSSQIEKIVPKDVKELLEKNEYANVLDKYLPLVISDKTLEDPIIAKLEEENKLSPWEYNFNGVIISRKKLLRNYEFLMTNDFIDDRQKESDVENILLVSAIYNSRLDAKEIEVVNDVLSTNVKIGGEHNAVLKK